MVSPTQDAFDALRFDLDQAEMGWAGVQVCVEACRKALTLLESGDYAGAYAIASDETISGDDWPLANLDQTEGARTRLVSEISEELLRSARKIGMPKAARRVLDKERDFANGPYAVLAEAWQVRHIWHGVALEQLQLAEKMGFFGSKSEAHP